MSDVGVDLLRYLGLSDEDMTTIPRGEPGTAEGAEMGVVSLLMQLFGPEGQQPQMEAVIGDAQVYPGMEAEIGEATIQGDPAQETGEDTGMSGLLGHGEADEDLPEEMEAEIGEADIRPKQETGEDVGMYGFMSKGAFHRDY